jgi:hypothetical protein
MTRTDSLRRDSNPTAYEALSEGTQAVLRRAASYRHPRTCKLSTEQAAEIDRDWLMVPSKRGPRQVVVSSVKCWAL